MLAFKAQEIEELADVYFFRPLGMVLARAARALGLTPTAVTIIGMLVGAAGGGLLYDARLGYAAFALLIVHGVLDSADGQLARLTGRATEFGRMLDGVSGYVTHVAIYAGLTAGAVHQGSGGGGAAAIVLWAVAAGLGNIVHAQMYDYHRTAYARYVIKGQARSDTAGTQPARVAGAARGIVGRYEALEARLAGVHPEVERALAARSFDGRVRADDRERYRSCFYWPVRGWNLFGDNTRFYAIGVLAWLARPDWFFTFLLGPMNVAFVVVWLWQARADRRFLEGL